MHILISILINTIAVLITGKILPGIHVSSFGVAILVAIVFGLINAILRPILLILTLPLNILTLGLFTFVIMGLCAYIASAIVPGFKIDNFGWAILFALIVAIINGLLSLIFPK